MDLRRTVFGILILPARGQDGTALHEAWDMKYTKYHNFWEVEIFKTSNLNLGIMSLKKKKSIAFTSDKILE